MSAVPSTGGFRDYPHGHDDLWPEVKRLIPVLREREYFSYPRGRVLWVEASNCYRILGPSKLMARSRVIVQIVRRFGLSRAKVEVVVDDHYDPAGDADFAD
jgi:hypothetical protein